jgi:hypothetical protein
VLATVLFTDIVCSTERLSGAGDRAWRDILDHHDRVAAERVSRFGGTLVKTTGDGLLATFGGPSSAIEAAKAVPDSIADLDLSIRAGIHTGEVELRQEDVGGIAVHIGARIAALAQPGEIWVSRTVKDLVTGSGLDFADRAEHALKGVPGQLAALRAEQLAPTTGPRCTEPGAQARSRTGCPSRSLIVSAAPSTSLCARSDSALAAASSSPTMGMEASAGLRRARPCPVNVAPRTMSDALASV